MKRNLILATVLAAAGASAAGLAMAAGTSTTEGKAQTELQLFQSAKVNLDAASQIALREVPGALAGIGFNDEDGRGVWEARVLGAGNQPSIVKIDADNGAVLDKGPASQFAEDDDHEDDHGNGDSDEGDNDNDETEES